jgi:hypothetical protein
MLFEQKNISRDTFVSAIDDDKANKFAKTFVAKADMLGAWDSCVGLFNSDGELAGAVIWTLSKRNPIVCNLQLLHTFAKFRKNGVGHILMNTAKIHAMIQGAKYFRVSSEPESVGFYEKIGYRFWGKQKSGCQLCMFELPGIYQVTDPVIFAAIHKKGKGGVVELSAFYHEQVEFNKNFLQALLND